MTVIENKCLKEMLGNCTGCQIREMVEDRSKIDPEKAINIRERIQRDLCPSDLTMDPIRPIKRSIW